MQWINQTELQNWADRIGSREQFPVMIRVLILASVRDIGDIQYIRFPGGEAGQIRGYDGDLTMAVGTPYIPAGRSIWEFGTNEEPAKKFKNDYENRVKDTDESIRKDLTFVFATPRSWDNPRLKLPDFVKGYKDKGEFADVRYIDGAMLDTWLQEHGAVGAKHARLVLGTVPNRGVRSTEEFWNEFSHRYRQQLTEEVALAGRSDQAKQIVDHLMSARGSLVFVGDGPDEVTAVAVAAIRQADRASREFMEARTLVVDTDDAGRLLSQADRYAYILSPTVKEVGESLASFGPTVSTLDYRPKGNAYSRLERPSIREMSEALKSMSYDEEEAEKLARKSGRSLTILHRLAPRCGFCLPSWVEGGGRLVPALLASAWSTQQPGDLQIIADLSGSSYEEYEQTLRHYLPYQDTPIDLRGGLWKFQAPVDAFVNLSHLITPRHFEALHDAAIKVFMAETPPDIAEERFGRSAAPYSSLLREGIATTLLIIAAMHEEVGLEVGLDPEKFVNNLVADLPGLRDDVRVILGLEDQLTYLMEAAPRPLLAALEHLLEGDEVAAVLFQEKTSYGTPRSQIPNLLWALELLAWDPAFFRRAALLLAKLASKDPGGQCGNRPISSLRNLFTAWSPGTNAPMIERIAVVDEIIADYPFVGWQLITMLLPKLQDSQGSTPRPRYRDAGASDKEILTNGIVWETYDAMADRALSLVGDNNARWIELAEAFPRFPPERREQFLAMLVPYAEHTAGEERVELRRVLRRLADRHARFRQAAWVLPEEELTRLQSIVGSMETMDPFDQARTLFDEQNPYPVEDIAASELATEQRRMNAVANLAATFGAEAVIRLAGTVRFSHAVAIAVAKGIKDKIILERILVDGDPQAPASDLSRALAGMLRHRRGEEYDAEILSLADRSGWSPVRTASMLLDWPEGRHTWALVDALGTEAEKHFWQNRYPFRFEGPLEELEELVRRFVAVGRAGCALSVAHPRERELSWQAVTAILGGRIAEINEGKIDKDIDGYLLGELFKSIRNREDVDQLELAHWEYAFFPVLEYQEEDLALYERMASDPEFFVSIMMDVFVADDVDPGERETTPEQRNRASISYHILTHNKRVPGQKKGKINQAELDAWINGMKEEAIKQKRTKIVPSYIGRTLAHASEADGVWPPPEVASAIERLRSDDVEQSIMIERLNMRGVYKKSLFEGGNQERDLADQYRRWSVAHGQFPRTKALLAAIAEQWDRDAKHADEAAERDKVRFG